MASTAASRRPGFGCRRRRHGVQDPGGRPIRALQRGAAEPSVRCNPTNQAAQGDYKLQGRALPQRRHAVAQRPDRPQPDHASQNDADPAGAIACGSTSVGGTDRSCVVVTHALIKCIQMITGTAGLGARTHCGQRPRISDRTGDSVPASYARYIHIQCLYDCQQRAPLQTHCCVAIHSGIVVVVIAAKRGLDRVLNALRIRMGYCHGRVPRAALSEMVFRPFAASTKSPTSTAPYQSHNRGFGDKGPIRRSAIPSQCPVVR